MANSDDTLSLKQVINTNNILENVSLPSESIVNGPSCCNKLYIIRPFNPESLSLAKILKACENNNTNNNTADECRETYLIKYLIVIP